jgi:hypothetical protein
MKCENRDVNCSRHGRMVRGRAARATKRPYGRRNALQSSHRGYSCNALKCLGRMADTRTRDPVFLNVARRPRALFRMILFLDFDGVLHPDPCRDPTRLFEQAPRLAAVLEDFPEVSIVLSTSWRTTRTIDELAALLPAPMRPRIVGMTPHFSEIDVPPRLVPYRRQAECAEWFERHAGIGETWLALDDRPSWFEPYFEALIECDSTRGFDEAADRRLRSALVIARRRRGFDAEQADIVR